MRSRLPHCLALALAATFFAAGNACADGRAVMPWFHRGQYRPGLAADGAGGAWVAFKTGDLRMVLARLSADGIVRPDWPAGVYDADLGLRLSSGARVLANGAERVVVVSDYCAYDRLAMAYGADGDAIGSFPASASQFYPAPGAVLTPDGGVLAAVTAGIGLNSSGVRLAVVSPLGTLASEAEVGFGVQVPTGEPFATAPDGTGGLYVGVPIYYSEDYSSGLDVALMLVASDGSRPWTGNWRTVCTANANQRQIRVAPDGTGGALVAWADERTGGSPMDVYGARFTSAGTPAAGWTAQGKRITSATGAQFEPRVVDDGGSGAWFVWRDERVADINLYFNRVQGNGAFAPGFSAAGTLLCGAAGAQSDVQVVPDGAGGFFAVWLDPRDGEADLYGTHITSAGVPAPGWPADGLALCDAASQQLHPALAATGVNRAMLAWRDTRADSGHVYALALGNDGPVTTGVGPGPGGALRLRAAANPCFGTPELWLAGAAGEPVEIELVDVAGRVVRRGSGRGEPAEARVSLGGGPLPAGVYFAVARQGGSRATVRVCVLR